MFLYCVPDRQVCIPQSLEIRLCGLFLFLGI
jgi:hypothetical protein